MGVANLKQSPAHYELRTFPYKKQELLTHNCRFKVLNVAV